MAKNLNTTEAGLALGISRARVIQLLDKGDWINSCPPTAKPAKVGRDWVIPESSLKYVTVYGKAGRPAKD